MNHWDRMRSAPRQRALDVQRSDIPTTPGVYAWWRDDEPVYVGEAKTSLRRRLRDHLGTAPDLSRSTLRRSVALALLDIPRDVSAARPSQVTQADADVVTAWLRGCDLSWLTCATAAEAHDLETALRTEWLPPLNRR